VIRLACLLLAALLPRVSVAAPPFWGTIFLDPDILTESDPTTFETIDAAGQGQRQMYDRRFGWIQNKPFLFDAAYSDGLAIEVQVNSEFGSAELAKVEAAKYAVVIGRLPKALRRDVETVWIHKGEEPFGGGNNNLLIHVGQAALYVADGILEETLVHEAAHTSLDGDHAAAEGWLSAQSADNEFISTYAQDNPEREDIAESFLPFLAVVVKPETISTALAETIQATIPNRIAYFTSLNLDLRPMQKTSMDEDADGVANEIDNCPRVTNLDQLDTDGDSTGNACDDDDDDDGVLDVNDAFALDNAESVDTDEDGIGNAADPDDDNDGVDDEFDAFSLDATESSDQDGDGVGDNTDNCSRDVNAGQLDTDGDSEGDACDLDDDNDGVTDEQEGLEGTDPFNRFSCKSGCFGFDVDDDAQAQALTDGLLVIRHLFGFSGLALTSGAVGNSGGRTDASAIVNYLKLAEVELDIDGNGKSEALTDGLLLIRYLFGFSGDALINGAIGNAASRDTADAVEAYIKARMPAGE
jgi:hypothetical protein